MTWFEIVCHVLLPGFLGGLAAGRGIVVLPWPELYDDGRSDRD